MRSRWITVCAIILGLLLALRSTGAQPPSGQPEKPIEQPPPVEGQNEIIPAENPDAKRVREEWGQVLKGLFGQGREPAGEDLGTDTPLTPTDPRLQGLLKRALRETNRGKTREATEYLQRILADQQDTLIPAEARKLGSLRSRVRQMLLKLPAADLQRYQREIAGDAQLAWREAQADDSMATLQQVADRYLLLPEGQTAADRLVGRFLDRAEYGLAARWCRELLAVQAPITRTAKWQARAALVAQRGEDVVLEKQLKGILQQAESPVQLGGRTVPLSEWLKTLPVPAPFSLPLVNEWLSPWGNARHVATVSIAEPLLLERWRTPLTESAPIQDKLLEVVRELRDQHDLTVSSCLPIFVDGKIVIRTAGGVKVFLADSGELQWQTREENSLEQILLEQIAGGTQPERSAFQEVVQNFELDDLDLDAHPLVELLFANEPQGLVSSDGQRLFVLEEQTYLAEYTESLEDATGTLKDELGRLVGANRLVAYDLNHGTCLWGQGGQATGTPQGNELGGVFFFGPPVVDGDELFLVGELKQEIQLFVLRASDGKLLWSRLLARAQQHIRDEPDRQRTSAQVAIGAGVVVCPTTQGWLIGIDRQSHGYLWGYDLLTSAQRESISDPDGMNWEDDDSDHRRRNSPPQIIGNRVVYLPREGTRQVCLKVATGEPVWERARDEDLWIAAITPDMVITVTPQALIGRSLSRGDRNWQLKFASSGQKPCGRGVLVGSLYYQPLTGGELWGIDTKTGKVQQRHHVPAGNRTGAEELGHLAIYRGQLHSTTVLGITAFAERFTFEQKLAQAVADPETQLDRAQQALLERRFPAALDLLRDLPTDGLSTAVAARWRQLKWDVLAGAVQADLLAGDLEFPPLAEMAESSAEKIFVLTMQVQRQRARANWTAVLETMFRWAQQHPEQSWVVEAESGRQVRGDVWLASQWQQMWPLLPEEQRQSVARQARDLVAPWLKSGEADSRSLEIAARIFRVLPEHVEWERELILRDLKSTRWAQAEVRLLRWLERKQPELTAEALSGLITLCEDAQRTADALSYACQLAELDQKASLVEGSPARTLLDAWQARLAQPHAIPPALNWQGTKLRAERMGAETNSYFRQFSTVTVESDLPWFQRHRWQYDENSGRLQITNVMTERSLWSWPIPIHQSDEQADSSCENAPTIQPVGHLAVLSFRGNVLAIDPIQQQVIWQTTAESPANACDDWIYERDYEMGGPSFRTIAQGAGRLAPLGKLSLNKLTRTGWDDFLRATADGIVVRGRHSLEGLDSLTGERLWIRTGLSTDLQYMAGPEFLLVRRERDSRTELWSMRDGRSLEPANWSSQLGQAALFDGQSLIRQTPVQSPSSPQSQLLWEAVQPLTGVRDWEHSFPVGSLGTRLPNQQFLVLLPDQNLQILHLKTGRVQTVGKLDPADVQRVQDISAIATPDLVFLVINRSRRLNNETYPEEFTRLRVQGMLCAFDRHQEELLWKQSLSGLYLATDLLQQSPVCVLAARQLGNADPAAENLHLLMLDQWTGKNLFELKMQAPGGFSEAVVNLPERYVELRSYVERLRVLPGEVAVGTAR